MPWPPLLPLRPLLGGASHRGGDRKNLRRGWEGGPPDTLLPTFLTPKQTDESAPRQAGLAPSQRKSHSLRPEAVLWLCRALVHSPASWEAPPLGLRPPPTPFRCLGVSVNLPAPWSLPVPSSDRGTTGAQESDIWVMADFCVSARLGHGTQIFDPPPV